MHASWCDDEVHVLHASGTGMPRMYLDVCSAKRIGINYPARVRRSTVPIGWDMLIDFFLLIAKSVAFAWMLAYAFVCDSVPLSIMHSVMTVHHLHGVHQPRLDAAERKQGYKSNVM